MQRRHANVGRVRTWVHSHRRFDVRLIAEELNMNKETVRQIIKENLWMRTISAKMVPWILTEEKMSASHFIWPLTQCRGVWYGHYRWWNVVFSTWLRKKMPEHAVENTEFTSAEKKHACLARSSRLCLCFFDYEGIVHYEFIAQGQMEN
jgi:hypothetical protein